MLRSLVGGKMGMVDGLEYVMVGFGVGIGGICMCVCVCKCVCVRV